MANAHEDNIPQQILYEYNFLPHHNSRYERWLLDSTVHVFRFCNKIDATNIHVKYDEDEA